MRGKTPTQMIQRGLCFQVKDQGIALCWGSAFSEGRSGTELLTRWLVGGQGLGHRGGGHCPYFSASQVQGEPALSSAWVTRNQRPGRCTPGLPPVLPLRSCLVPPSVRASDPSSRCLRGRQLPPLPSRRCAPVGRLTYVSETFPTCVDCGDSSSSGSEFDACVSPTAEDSGECRRQQGGRPVNPEGNQP